MSPVEVVTIDADDVQARRVAEHLLGQAAGVSAKDLGALGVTTEERKAARALEEEQAEALRIERLRAERVTALEAATHVRREYVRTLLGAPGTLPSEQVAWAMVTMRATNLDDARSQNLRTRMWHGIPVAIEVVGEPLLRRLPRRADWPTRLWVVLAVGYCERRPVASVVRNGLGWDEVSYLRALRTWGHTLSEVEETLLEEAAFAAASAEGVEEES